MMDFNDETKVLVMVLMFYDSIWILDFKNIFSLIRIVIKYAELTIFCQFH